MTTGYSEAPTMPPIAPAPADLQPHTKETARQLYEKAGYAAADIEKAGYGSKPPVGTPGGDAPPVTGPTKQPTIGNVGYIAPHDGVNIDQRIAGFKTLLQFNGDTKGILQAAKAYGISASELGVSAEEAAASGQLDEAPPELPPMVAAPASPDAYKLQFKYAANLPNLADLNKDFGQAFHSAGVPVPLAQSLIDAMTASETKYGMLRDTNAQDFEAANQTSRLLATGNGQEVMRLANVAVNALPKDFAMRCSRANSFRTVEVISVLASIGRAIEYRNSRTKK